MCFFSLHPRPMCNAFYDAHAPQTISINHFDRRITVTYPVEIFIILELRCKIKELYFMYYAHVQTYKSKHKQFIFIDGKKKR